MNNVTIFIQSSSALRSCVAILSCPCLWFWPWGFLIRLRFHSPPNMRFMVRHRAQVTAAQKKKHVAALALQQLMYSGSNMLPIDRSSTGQTSAEENVVRHCIVSLPTRCTMEIYLYLAETVYERYSCLLHPKSSDFQSCVAIFFKSSLRSGMCPTGIQHFQFPPITFFFGVACGAPQVRSPNKSTRHPYETCCFVVCFGHRSAHRVALSCSSKSSFWVRHRPPRVTTIEGKHGARACIVACVLLRVVLRCKAYRADLYKLVVPMTP